MNSYYSMNSIANTVIIAQLIVEHLPMLLKGMKTVSESKFRLSISFLGYP